MKITKVNTRYSKVRHGNLTTDELLVVSHNKPYEFEAPLTHKNKKVASSK